MEITDSVDLSKCFKLKDLLKSGYVVKLNNGTFRMFMTAGTFSNILVAEDGTWTDICHWDDELRKKVSTFNYDRGGPVPLVEEDIVEIWGYMKSPVDYRNILKISPYGRRLVWRSFADPKFYEDPQSCDEP